MRERSWIFCCLTLLTLLRASTAIAAENAATLRAAMLSITADDLQSHVDVLADDSFEGREAGSRGGRAAGIYLLKHFEEQGLQGGGADGTFFQPFGNGCRNVVGYLEGRDPDLRREVVLVGAHYDHVGYGNRGNSYGPFGYVHNGADDNASGVAGLLEVLDAIAMLPQRPRRSILFCLWDGEEKGLLGSKHWVYNPTVSLNNVVLAINIDMIGRLRSQGLEVYGTRTAAGLRRRLSELNHESDVKLDFTWEIKPNSDHYPFFESNIPFLMFHTGLHDNYHRPSDDAHLVNTDGMQQVSRLLFHCVHELSELEQIAKFRAASQWESPGAKEQLETPLGPAPPRLGVRWQKTSTESEGLRLTEVDAGSAADRAGLRIGDRILRFAGREIPDPAAFQRAVMKASSPVPVVTVREGESEPRETLVNLDGKPTRIGISWRSDDAEPGTTIVSRVIDGSPAGDAGLATGDRIYEVGGRRFDDTQELYELLTTLPGPIALTVERRGRLRIVELDVPTSGAETAEVETRETSDKPG